MQRECQQKTKKMKKTRSASQSQSNFPSLSACSLVRFSFVFASPPSETRWLTLSPPLPTTAPSAARSGASPTAASTSSSCSSSRPRRWSSSSEPGRGAGTFSSLHANGGDASSSDHHPSLGMRNGEGKSSQGARGARRSMERRRRRRSVDFSRSRVESSSSISSRRRPLASVLSLLSLPEVEMTSHRVGCGKFSANPRRGRGDESTR